MVDVITELAREGELSELLYVNCLGLMCKVIDTCRNMFRKLNVSCCMLIS